MKVAYITAFTPWGTGESFILKEMIHVVESGTKIAIIPRNPPKQTFHRQADDLLEHSYWLPLINFKMILYFLGRLLSDSKVRDVFKDIFKESRSVTIALKNFVVVPKAIYLTPFITRSGIDHIHAHWGTTTATMAYCIAQCTGIPWSFTLHRWDIKEDNMLRKKAETASFIRCISEQGKRELIEIIGTELISKSKVIHMGVEIPRKQPKQQIKDKYIIACPANFLPVKGGRYLIEACKILIDRGIKDFECWFIGDGPIEGQLRDQIKDLDLKQYVVIVGRVPHDHLMGMYEKGEIDIVCIPSINTEDGEKEGIPVALMEAMSYNIPVVSTSTGAIPELLQGEAGKLVDEKNAVKLADALQELLKNRTYSCKIGFDRINEKYNLKNNVDELLDMMF